MFIALALAPPMPAGVGGAPVGMATYSVDMVTASIYKISPHHHPHHVVMMEGGASKYNHNYVMV